jgi:hypothetical protein
MRSLITATAASSLISTFFIGYFGNLPLALAPGIGAAALNGCDWRAGAFGHAGGAAGAATLQTANNMPACVAPTG